MHQISSPILLLTLGVALSTQASDGAEAPSEDTLRNLSYSGILGDAVQLVDGRWVGPPAADGGASRPVVELGRFFRHSADLDGDGRAEAVVLLSHSSGGSGVFSYLAVVGRSNDTAINLGTAPLGDRVQVRAARVSDNRIELDLVQASATDAACCPSQLVTRVFALRDGQLEEVSRTETGVLSLAALGEGEWMLSHFSWSEAAPEEPRITLAHRDGRVGGSSGCNRYFTSPEIGEAPGEVTFGPIGSTRMACPEEAMALESRYLQALGKVSGYGFVNGKLALRWIRDDESESLLFDPAPTPTP